jgi:uroporphyrinogen decarboxylase
VGLIGFAGAPWTVASYMVAGQGTADQAPGRLWMYQDMEGFADLIGLLTKTTIRYLGGQIAAGAEAVMLFDSWAGALPADLFERFVIGPAAQIARALADTWPQVPMIGFPRGAGVLYPEFARQTGVAGVGLDSTVPLDWARAQMSPDIALQGNLDPMLLVAGGKRLEETARRMVQTMADAPYIFNLGHGIVPQTDLVHVEALLREVRR